MCESIYVPCKKKKNVQSEGSFTSIEFNYKQNVKHGGGMGVGVSMCIKIAIHVLVFQ